MKRYSRRSVVAAGLTALALLSLGAFALDLDVPKDVQTKKNPVTASDAVIASAKTVYEENCLMCHGENGGGDGPMAGMLQQKPSDLRDPAKMSGMTDGEIYWLLTKGVKPMPPFESKLSEEERWSLVHLMRNMSKTKPNTQPSKAN